MKIFKLEERIKALKCATVDLENIVKSLGIHKKTFETDSTKAHEGYEIVCRYISLYDSKYCEGCDEILQAVLPDYLLDEN